MIRADERGDPDQPVACTRCGVQVLVKKNSLPQTSVQWLSRTSQCPEMDRDITERAFVGTCHGLRDSIEEAVRAQQVEVPSG